MDIRYTGATDYWWNGAWPFSVPIMFVLSYLLLLKLPGGGGGGGGGG